MANGLLDLLGGLGTTPPSYLEGLLGAQPVEDLRKRSIGTGVANALIGYLAAPKNQNLGLGRILASSAQAGLEGARGVYTDATQDYMQAQKIAEIKRKQQEREAYDTAAKNLFTQVPAQYETQQVSGGGYLPSGEQVAGGATPNFNVSSQYAQPTTQQVMTEPAYQTLNKDALMKLAAIDSSKAKDLADVYSTLNPVAKRNVQQVGNQLVDVSGDTPKVIYTGQDKPVDYSTNDRNAISFGEFGTAFSNLNQNQAKLVNQRLDEAKKATARAGALQLPPEALGLGKTGQTKLDDALLSSGDRLAQLNQIQMNFRPEYQTIPYKTSAAWVGLKDKFNFAKPEEQANLKNYAAFRQDSVRQLNTYINEITGAAIGQGEEADRIKAGVPNVGSGMFDGDSPAEFQAKLNNTTKSLRLAEARLAYIKRNGLAITNIKLDEMPSLIAKREREIINANKLDITNNLTHRQQLKQQLATEFGLVY
jgi:hypothetical protein